MAERIYFDTVAFREVGTDFACAWPLSMAPQFLRCFCVVRSEMMGSDVAINQMLQNRKLAQTVAARHLNVNQPKIPALSSYHLDGFSVDRLMLFLTALDQDVE